MPRSFLDLLDAEAWEYHDDDQRFSDEEIAGINGWIAESCSMSSGRRSFTREEDGRTVTVLVWRDGDTWRAVLDQITGRRYVIASRLA